MLLIGGSLLLTREALPARGRDSSPQSRERGGIR